MASSSSIASRCSGEICGAPAIFSPLVIRLRFQLQKSSPPSKPMIGIWVNGASPGDCSFWRLNGYGCCSAATRSGRSAASWRYAATELLHRLSPPLGAWL
jgi:hypothetical protein